MKLPVASSQLIAALPMEETKLEKPRLTARKALHVGWKVLAGGFHVGCPVDQKLAASILGHIERTGGKAALVDAGHPMVEIWRPSAEMESIEQTENRLKRDALSR